MNKPHNYYCHKFQSQANLASNSLNYQIVQKIGEGAFGQVFKIFNPASSQLHVLKKNKNQDPKFNIQKQNQIMKEMSESQGFAKVKNNLSQSLKAKKDQYIPEKHLNQQISNSAINNKGVLIMQCLGESLGSICELLSSISIFTTKRIAYQLIKRLQQLHVKMYVHRDLKPDNILLGNQLHPHQIYLVDFGLVSKYRKNAISIRNIYEGVIGTAKFCSIASHIGNQQFPIDDLQSLGYVLVYLMKGQLPWKINQVPTQKNNFQQIKNYKQKVTIDQLSGGISCMKKYFKIIRSLKYSDQIPYESLLKIFQTQAKQQFCFQFCKQKCLWKRKRSRTPQNSQELRKVKTIEQKVSIHQEPHACNIKAYKM